MKRLICLFAFLLLACALAAGALAADFSASGLTVSGSAQQLGKARDYGSAKVTASVPAENPVVSGESPLTGVPFHGDYQLVLANIDTHPRALPHWGVASADLIYELPIQADGSTRSLALFMTEHPDSAGPIRSARVPMASLREMWGGTYCFYGYQGGRDKNNVKDWVTANSTAKRFAHPYYLNGMTKNSAWFSRSSDHNHVAPYNVRLDMNAVLADGPAEANIHPFCFTDDPLTRGEAVNGVIISYKATSPAYVSAYQYNEATGLYDRYRNGEPYCDGDTGEHCAYANVIVIRTDISWASGNPSRPVIRLNGQGVCEIFQNGQYIRGTWVRESTETRNLNNRMVFLDENGQELPMQRGKTFIQIVDNGQPVVVLADQKIEGSVEPQEQRLTIGTGSTKSSKSSKPRATRTPKPTATPEATATPEPELSAPEQNMPEQTEPVQPDQTEPDQTEPEQNEPEQTEPVQPNPEPNQPEQTEPEQNTPEQNEPEQSEPVQPDPEPNQPEQSVPEQSTPEQTEPEQNLPEQTEPEQSAPVQPDPEQSEPEQSMPEQAVPEQSEPAQTEPETSTPAQSESKQDPPKQAAQNDSEQGAAKPSETTQAAPQPVEQQPEPQQSEPAPAEVVVLEPQAATDETAHHDSSENNSSENNSSESDSPEDDSSEGE